MGFLPSFLSISQNPLFPLKNPNSWDFTFLHLTSSTLITSITMSTISLASSLSSNPLFSSIVAIYLLILLYFPHLFLHILLSPVFISTLILLFSLLRLGVSQQLTLHNDPNEVRTQPSPGPGPKPKPIEQSRVGVEPTQQAAETEPHCSYVETQPETDLGPATEPEPVKVETQLPTESGPAPDPEPINFDPDWKQIDSSQREGAAELFCNSVETRPLKDPDSEPVSRLEIEAESEKLEPDPDPHCQFLDHPNTGPNPFPREFFVKWDVGAPLEVIYEAFEGEEEGEDGKNDAFDQGNCTDRLERYPSLSRYYPESGSELESDSDSGSDSSESSWGREFPSMEGWDEDEREGLIEIALDYHGDKQGSKKLMEVVHGDDEDDNLIEIDISPTRTSNGFYW